MKIGNGSLLTIGQYQSYSGEYVSISLHTDNAEEIIAALDTEFGTSNYNARWTNSNLGRVADAAAAIKSEQDAQIAAAKAAVLAAKRAAVAGTADIYDYAGKKKARMFGIEFEWDMINDSYHAHLGSDAKKTVSELNISDFYSPIGRHIQRNSKGGMWSWHIVIEAWEVPCSNSCHKFKIIGEKTS